MKTEVSYSTISENWLFTNLVPLYLIDNPTICRFWHRGGDDIYQVHTENDIYMLRVYRHGVHSKEDINFEIAALNYLKNHGARIASPIAKRDGGYVSELDAPEGQRHAVVTTHAKGMEPGYCGSKDIYERDAWLFGESVAELHKLSKGFETSHKRHNLDIGYLYDASLDAIRTYILETPLFTANERQASQEKLLSVIAAILEHLNTIQPDKLDIGFCHGDCHGSNVHNDNGLLTQFDFEDCAIGFRAYDIATFKWAINGEDNEKELWPSFLKGYHSVRRPGTEDLKSIPIFVAIRQLWWIAFTIRNLPDFGYDDAGGNFICRQLSRIQGMLSASDD